ncbi:ornithine carbamoyltransferase [Cohaesibacter gelatinilyticus]|uniref:Ornithine carbamoyltransferase n=1 Tax=Cohaesibacter gelatinilyticus TaxID=372072 RepID=A0A285PGY6_9HYPH|nr:ornithine carbamoyltransferase [Cohaesibacter gelatinilyticus]SNZ20678.1 ornithine carbamoyltransferase [Cohaesibacter gelatinilyticus]HAT87090.1 ornithine carbamoyltransferase [Hyphomicrobiales bacterium]
MTSNPVRHFIDIEGMDTVDIKDILATAHSIKKARQTKRRSDILQDQTLAMIFDKPSTRTRVSFDVGMRELGGEPLMLTGQEMQLGRGESISDTAKVLSRFVDGIMIRMLDHEAVCELAKTATVPVINALTYYSHPCQIMADIMTYEEHRGSLDGKVVTWVGDYNNVLVSWLHAAEHFDFTIRVAVPSELMTGMDEINRLKDKGLKIEVCDTAEEAAVGSDLIITDTWVSMGDEDAERRHNLLKPYQVNTRLMEMANDEALFMHCLPAHRGEEVTDEVMDGPQSVVFDEAENRLHAQKGVLAWCFNKANNDLK